MADHDFLLAGDVFSHEMLSDWIKSKMCEERELQLRPHPYEIELYFDL
jgi:glutamine synthetase